MSVSSSNEGVVSVKSQHTTHNDANEDDNEPPIRWIQFTSMDSGALLLDRLGGNRTPSKRRRRDNHSEHLSLPATTALKLCCRQVPEEWLKTLTKECPLLDTSSKSKESSASKKKMVSIPASTESVPTVGLPTATPTITSALPHPKSTKPTTKTSSPNDDCISLPASLSSSSSPLPACEKLLDSLSRQILATSNEEGATTLPSDVVESLLESLLVTLVGREGMGLDCYHHKQEDSQETPPPDTSSNPRGNDGDNERSSIDCHTSDDHSSVPSSSSRKRVSDDLVRPQLDLNELHRYLTCLNQVLSMGKTE